MPAHRDLLIVAGSCHTPATILEPPAGVSAIGSAIFLHGLGANRRTMMYLGDDFAGHGFRTYLLDLPGHGDNTDPFTFAKAEQCADTVRSTRSAAAASARSEDDDSDRTFDGRGHCHSHGGPQSSGGNDCDFASADGAAAADAREFAGF